MRPSRAVFLIPLVAACAAVLPGRSWEVRRDIVYHRAGGTILLADAWVPDGPGPHPAVLLVHGGGWSRGKREDMEGIAKRLVRRGFVVLNVSYRLAPDHRYPAALEDLRLALHWLKDHATELKADSGRVAAWGYSAGAHLAGLLAYESDSSAGLKAVVLGGTPADLRRYPEGRMVVAFLGKTMKEDPELFGRASLDTHVGASSPPTYLYHARGDILVEPEQARILEAALRRAGVPVELDMVPWSSHVTLFLLRPAAVERAAGFLERRLMHG